MVDTGLAKLGYDYINIGSLLRFVILFSFRLSASQFWLKKKFENSTFLLWCCRWLLGSIW